MAGEQAPGPLAGALGGKSLPLDVGCAKKTPHQLRLAVGIGDTRCQAPGCIQPGWQCEPHHLCHREHGGPTSLTNLSNLCWWHHHVTRPGATHPGPPTHRGPPARQRLRRSPLALGLSGA